MATYLYRCYKIIKHGPGKGTRCNTRRALPRKVEEYVRPPKCKTCGAELSTIDNWQRKKNRDPSNLCNCDGFESSMRRAKHRKGSKWCNHYKGEYTDEELRERHLI